MRRRWFLIGPAAIVLVALFTFIGGEAVKLLWNWLLPPLFGWRELTFWQALGLLCLCRILFGGFGGHRSYRSGMRGRVAERMRARWDRMTPEERERFRAGLAGRCGAGPAPGSPPLV